MSPRPQEVTDRYGQVWTLVPDYDCYRHDWPTGTILSPLGELQLNNAAPGNVFEWCWEHSAVYGGYARRVLLHLAFHAYDDSPQPWLGYRTIARDLGIAEDDVRIAVGILAGLDEILIEDVDLGPDMRDRWDLTYPMCDVVYSFPAYEKWLTQHEVAT